MAISDAKELKIHKYCYGLGYPFLISSYFRRPHRSCIYVTKKLAGTDAETIFLVMTERLFTPFMAGLIWSAVLAAYHEYCIRSTISNSLCYLLMIFTANIIHKTATDKELVLVSRIVVLLVAAISIFLALNPDSLILTMVVTHGLALN